MKPQDIVYSYLKNYIASIQEAGSYRTDVVKAISILEGKKKALEQQKKKQMMEINQQIAKVDARLELVEKEISDCQVQLDEVKKQHAAFLKEDVEKNRGLFARLLSWFRNLFLRKG